MSFPQTPLNNAFDFNSTIKPQQTVSAHLTTCIYCSNQASIPLIADGSFRQCTKCRKNFRAQIINLHQKTPIQNSQPVSYQAPMFQTMRPIYMPPPLNK